MARFAVLVICLMAMGLADPASAAKRKPLPALPDLASGGHFTIIRVVDGETLVLDDGRQLRLSGLDLAVRSGWVPRSTGAAAETALRELTVDHRVELRFDRNPADRYGRVLAQVVRDDGLWIQGELLKRGLARVHGMSDNRVATPAMLAIEARARASHRGIWAKSGYAVRRPETATAYLGSYQIFEGRITEGGRGQGQIFLNFGSDRTRDLTLRIAGEALALFRTEHLDPLAYVDKQVRARGWLRPRGRPLIDITHPEELELIGKS